MILTHFMPHALEHGFTEIQASMALGVMGAMNVVGTIASGWICDRRGRCGRIFFAHQVGAALGAALAGWVFEWTGTYTSAFISAALVAFVGAGLTLLIREEPVSSRPTPAPAEA